MRKYTMRTKSRSLKQKWVSERLWRHAGTLAGVVSRLNQVAGARSTLVEERNLIWKAIELIRMIDIKGKKEESWRIYANRYKS